MAAFVRFGIPHRYIGASTDTKPAVAEVGSLCYEYNTGKTFVTYNGADWTEYAPTAYLNDISAETLTLSGTTTALTFSAAATIVAASGLTLPAVTLGGAVTGNAQTISNANVTVGASRTLDVSAGTLTLAADQISGDKVEGGTINAITVNTLTLGTTLAGADKPFTGLGDFTFTDGSIIATATSDSATLIFKATDDDGVALAQLEVMRLVGANDPYVAFGGSQQSIFYNSGAITIGGNVTFGAGLAIASGAVNGNTLLFKANDTTFLTLATGATDAMTIANATMSGTWLASGTVTMPALTLGGAITGGAHVTMGDTYAIYSGLFKGRNSTYARWGDAATTAHSLDAEDDLMVTGELEVTGAAFFDGDVTMGTFAIAADSGAVTLVDMSVTDAPADNTEESLAFKIDGNTLFKLYAQADSAGAVDTMSVQYFYPLQGGTSASPLTLTVGTPTFSQYTTCADLGTGNAEAFYVKNTLTGAGAYGGRSRFDLVVNAAAGDYVNALKAYTSFGASGRVTGLASGFCAELALSAGTTSGSYAALEAELVAATGDPVGASTSFLYCNAGGTGSATVIDAQACLFYFGPQLSAGAGGFIDTSKTTHSAYGGIRMKCPDGSIKWLAVVSD
jgi:hypothetical protein